MRQKINLLIHGHPKVLLGICIFTVFIFGFGLSVTLFRGGVANISKTPLPTLSPAERASLPSEKGRNDYNVLLLGYGGAGHDGGNLSDVIKIINVNPDTKRTTIISVPRDLWVQIPVRSDAKEYFKINAAYAIGGDDRGYPLKETQYKGENGGSEMAKAVIGEVIGMPVDYTVAVDFSGFSEAIDILDGIQVEVPTTFDDYYYPIKGLENETCGASPEEIAEWHEKYSGFELEKQFACRYEHLHFDKGETYMDGETALKFVRSRHSDQHGGDFARAQRQEAVMTAIRNKALSLGALDDIPGFLAKFTSAIRTDLSPAILAEVAKQHPDVGSYPVHNVTLSTDNVLVNSTSTAGAYILTPKEGAGNWSGVQSYIQDGLQN